MGRQVPVRGWFAHDVEAGGDQCLGIERSLASEQFVKQHAQAVDVRAGVDVESAHFGLLGADVGRGADECLELGELRLVRQALDRWPWRCRNR
jgi:hypothetical protein